MNPKLSILVPIYNVETYLRQCLDSLLAQTLKDLEIICINDGSTDHSLDIIKEYAKRDLRIVVLNKKNSGYGDSMNQGLKRATGDYIGIVESDDWVEPDAFETLFRLAREHRADVVKANYYKFRTAKDGIEHAAPTSEISALETLVAPSPAARRPLFTFAPAIWSAIYRRKFLEHEAINFLPTPGASYQDTSFNFKVWTLARRIVLTPDHFVHYRIDNANSSINNPAKANFVIGEYAEIETFLTERGIFPQFSGLMLMAKFRHCHWNFQRLSGSLAKQFYQTWRQEFLAAEEEGLLQKPDFSRKDWLALRAILKHPRLAYRALRLRIAIKKFL